MTFFFEKRTNSLFI